jgi:cell shape-determining protein MreC
MEFMLNKTKLYNQLVNVETGEVTDVSAKMKELELENQRLKEILKTQDELSEDMKFGNKLAQDTISWNKYFNN